MIWSMTSTIFFFSYSFIYECFCLCVLLFVLKGRQRKLNDNFGLQDQVYFYFLYIYFFMCKNTGQPDFDPTLKRLGKGHRLCNPFRTIPFFYSNPHESNPNPIDLTHLPGLCLLLIWYYYFLLVYLT